jgi:hypothetical protein
MKNQRGISFYGVLYLLITLGFVGYIGMRAFPSVVEYFGIKKILASMANEEAKNATNVREIRAGFDRRAVIGYVTVISGEDLEITKEAGETVVSANWSVKVPLFAQASLLLDFSASTK